MQRRAGTSAVVVVLAALGLTGCSVPVLGVTGLTVQNGHVSAIVRTCSDITASELHMEPADRQEGRSLMSSWAFDPSSSVRVDLGAKDEFLELVGDDVQALQADLSDGVGGYLRFAAWDIEYLSEGAILASTSSSAFYETVDAEGFEDLVAEVCDDQY